MQTMSIPNAVAYAEQQLHAGNVAEAEDICRRVLAVVPGFGPAFDVLAQIALLHGRGDDAVALLRQAFEANPQVAGHLNNLGMVLAQLGRTKEAVDVLERCQALDPNSADAVSNLANCYITLGRFSDAVEANRRALAIKPGFLIAMHNLTGALNALGDLDGAIEQSRAVLAVDPDSIGAIVNFGRAHKEAGRLDQAIAFYRESDALRPNHHTLSELLFTLHLHPDYTPRQLLEEHLVWNQRYAVLQRQRRLPLPSDPSPSRRLRIGYVAYDLGNNALGRLAFALLSHHDTADFDIFCYSSIRRPDFVGQALAKLPITWRITKMVSDDLLAQHIRNDRIDVLIDLSMHSHGNRLLTFAQRPAPVQITYLAYNSTTGVETMDYRLTDACFDPPDSDQSVYVEKPLRLKSYWCYPVPPGVSDAVPPPVLSTGHITFGCLNDFSKINAPVLDLWARLLMANPGSRLILHCKLGIQRQAVLDRFAAAGVDTSRIEFISLIPTKDYFNTYKRIDIALDPFPWSGGITTCDALYMGVPVVTLPGPTAVSRGGASILTQVKLRDLIAPTREAFLQIATTLAQDTARLSSLRSSLRTTIQNSLLMNATAFARDAESLYRQAWQVWCSEQSSK
jgi:predicted O-linked N-acetylglucosamine transferase (SPINDLY family)